MNLNSMYSNNQANFQQSVAQQGGGIGALAAVREVTHIVRYQSRNAKEPSALTAPGAPYENEMFCTSLEEARGLAIGLVENGEAHPSTISFFSKCDLLIKVEAESTNPLGGK